MKKYQIAIISLVGALSLFFLALSSIILWAIFAGIVVLLVLLWRPKPQSSAPPRSTSRPTSADFEPSIPVIPAPSEPCFRVSFDAEGQGREPLIDRSPLLAVHVADTTSYIVIDTETTGFQRSSGGIVELALAFVEDGKITKEIDTLTNPGVPIPAAARAVHGISDADVQDCPAAKTVAAQTLPLLDGKIVVGHNISFDLDFLSAAASKGGGEPIEVQYIDTANLARTVFPGLGSYKLEDVCKSLGLLDGSQTHRAGDDVRLCYRLFEACRSELLERRRQAEEEKIRKRKAKKEAQAAKRAIYAWSPLLDRNFVFTGVFERDRRELESMLEKVGANLRGSVNTKTAFLVAGDTSQLPDWALDRKLHAAEALIEKGQNLQIISESEYLNLIESTVSSK